MKRPKNMSPRITLRILATTDIHGQIIGWDYARDKPLLGHALSHLAADIAALRAKDPELLLFDNGDFLQGTPLCDLASARLARDAQARHPVITAMNALGYDAVTLGNHEFNFGPDVLAAALAQGDFPVVSSNVRGLGPDVLPWLLIERVVDGARVKIGVLGLAPPRMSDWGDDLRAAGIEVGPMVCEGEMAAAALRARGADLVVALCHAGPHKVAGQETAAQVAEAGFADLVIAGHTHVVWPAARGRGNMVCAGDSGSHLAIADLTLAPRTGGGWQLVKAVTEARPCGKTADPAMTALVTHDHAATRDELSRVIGETPVRLDTHFALCGTSSALTLVAEAMLDAAAPFALAEGLPLLAAVAPFRTGRGGAADFVDLGPGPVRLRDLDGFCPFPDRLKLLRINGAGLSGWLNHAASQFNQIRTGQTNAPLIAPDFAPYNFDAVAGLCYRFDLRRAGGSCRITKLMHAGRSVAETDQFLMVTTSYKAGGGGGYPAGMTQIVDVDLPTLAKAVTSRLANGRAPQQDLFNWGFAAIEGATATFESAPRAQPQRSDCQPLGLTPEGLMRFALDLGATLARAC